MIPAAFDYASPSSLDEVISLLRQYQDDAKVLAGGHSLLPLMKLRLAAPGMLVDLGRVPDLAYIRDRGDYVAIGAMTTLHSMESSDLLRQRLPLVADTAGLVGDMQVRNRGTIGGNLAHADPASDFPSVITALGGKIVARGPDRDRIIDAQDFFQDIWTSALQPSEVLTEIRVPYAQGEPAQAYEKFRQRSQDWAIVGVAVNITRSNGSVGNASVVLANVGTTPVRATAVEDALRGQEANAASVRVAAERASEGLNPSAELRADPDYKRHLARVLTRRALERALQLS